MAFNPLGWKAVAFSEIEPFPCALLKHHYPDTPNWGDMTKFKDWPNEPIDLLCGGTPCQSFSVAGLRKGLADPRGNLMLTFGAIAAKYRPQWLVWENVPGVLSSNGGADFGAFLGMLGQLGYGFAYRVLDAQYFGVPQRRRRVFVVGCLGDWRSAAAVLFERHSLSGHPAPRRQAGQRFAASTAPSLTASGRGVERCGESRGQDPVIAVETLCIATGQAGAEIGAEMAPTLNCNHEAPYIAFDTTQITSVANYSNPQPGDPCHPLAAQAHVPCIAFPARLSGTQCATTENLAPSMGAANPTAIAFQERGRAGGPNLEIGGDVAFALTAPNGGGRAQERNVLSPSMQVRRLTPEECEALQGFPRGYTAVPHRGKPSADGPRYKALGNSWAVPCAAWIGERIQAVAHIRSERAAIENVAEEVTA